MHPKYLIFIASMICISNNNFLISNYSLLACFTFWISFLRSTWYSEMRSSFINIPNSFNLGDLQSMPYLWSLCNLLWHWSTYLYVGLFYFNSFIITSGLVILLYQKLWGSRLFCYAHDPIGLAYIHFLFDGFDIQIIFQTNYDQIVS